MQGIDRTLRAESQQIIYAQENFGKIFYFYNSFIPNLRVTILFRSMLPFLPVML